MQSTQLEIFPSAPVQTLNYSRCSHDETLFRILYPIVDPTAVASITLHVAQDLQIKARSKVGFTLLNSPSTNKQLQEDPKANQDSHKGQVMNLIIPFAGKIQQISNNFKYNLCPTNKNWPFTLRTSFQKGPLLLFTFRSCEHEYRSVKEFKNGTTLKTIKICDFCNQEVVFYYESAVTSLTLRELLGSVRFKQNEQLSWQIILNEYFTSQTVVAKYDQSELTVEFPGKATFLGGVADINELELETIVLKYRKAVCEHMEVKNGACVHCLCPVAETTYGIQSQISHLSLYDPEETSLTMREFIRDVRTCKTFRIKWKVSVNTPFTNRTPIAYFNDKCVWIQSGGLITYLCEESKESVSLEEVVVRYRKARCSHSTCKNGFCLECQCDVGPKDRYPIFFFQYEDEQTRPNILVGKDVQTKEEIYVSKLLAEEKALLALDLDNTILHSISLRNLDVTSIKPGFMDYFLLPISADLTPIDLQKYHIVKLRPFLREFLFQMTRIFQIYIYTKGIRFYADTICHMMRAKFAGEEVYPQFLQTWPQEKNLFLKGNNCFKPFRAISRDEDPIEDSKSPKLIVPNRKDIMIAVDDRKDVWRENPWFYTKPFEFFFLKKPSQANPTAQVAQPQKMIETSVPVAIPPLKQVIDEGEDEHSGLVPSNSKKQEEQEKMQPIDEIIEGIVSQLQSYIGLAQRSELKFPLRDFQPVYEIPRGCREDYYLLFAANALMQVHASYFEQVKRKHKRTHAEMQEKDEQSLNDCYLRLRRNLLNNRRIRFIGDENMQSQQQIIARAREIGAVVIENDQEMPQIIVKTKLEKDPSQKQKKKDKEKCAQKEGQSSYNEAIQKLKMYSQTYNIPIVSSYWITCTYENTYPFSHEPFVITDSLKQGMIPENEQFQRAREHRKEVAMEILGSIQKRMEM